MDIIFIYGNINTFFCLYHNANTFATRDSYYIKYSNTTKSTKYSILMASFYRYTASYQILWPGDSSANYISV